MTKIAFLEAYRALIAAHPWAADTARLVKAMGVVSDALNGGGGWDHNGPSTLLAWRAIGGKGKPTLKSLRALA